MIEVCQIVPGSSVGTCRGGGDHGINTAGAEGGGNVGYFNLSWQCAKQVGKLFAGFIVGAHFYTLQFFAGVNRKLGVNALGRPGHCKEQFQTLAFQTLGEHIFRCLPEFPGLVIVTGEVGY